VLDTIFGLVGLKEWLFVGAVCRKWRGRYFSMCSKAQQDGAATLTLHKATFATAARFELALDCGMPVKSTVAEQDAHARPYFDDLPRLSANPREVLTIARVRGFAWHDILTSDAAYYGHYELLKWLHRSGCPCDIAFSAVNVLRGSRAPKLRLDMLKWLHGNSSSSQWTAEVKQVLLFEAGAEALTAVIEYLLSDGAVWPASFMGVLNGCKATWHYQAVKWAIAKGCSWGAWRCQDLDAAVYSNAHHRDAARGLFRWAHEHAVNCPCTCEAAAVQAVPNT
jgi:hypothetical protein